MAANYSPHFEKNNSYKLITRKILLSYLAKSVGVKSASVCKQKCMSQLNF